MTGFKSNLEVVTFSVCGWCMLDVFVLPSFAHLGHEIDECKDFFLVHTMDLGLYSHPKEFLGLE